MTQISKRLEQIVRRELSRTVIPVKTAEGILVGNILIQCKHNQKFLYKQGELLYGDISLNQAAVAMANILAQRGSQSLAHDIYQADQEYARYYTDSQLLRASHEKSRHNGDFDRADTLWARYQETRDRARWARSRVESLAKSL